MRGGIVLSPSSPTELFFEVGYRSRLILMRVGRRGGLLLRRLFLFRFCLGSVRRCLMLFGASRGFLLFFFPEPEFGHYVHQLIGDRKRRVDDKRNRLTDRDGFELNEIRDLFLERHLRKFFAILLVRV